MKTILQIIPALILFFINSIQAQTVCTDIIPDTILNTDGEVYPLDLNNDGTVDFAITLTSTVGQYCCSQYQNQSSTITPQYGDAVLVTAQSANVTVDDSGTVISTNSATWSASADQSLAYENHFCTPFGCSSYYDGLWSAVNDKYAALRIKVGADTLYGWVRMSVGLNGSSVTIKSYAYKTIADMPSHVGDTCSIASNIFELATHGGLNVFPNPGNGLLTLDTWLNKETNKVGVDVIGILGTEVFHKTFQCNNEHFTQQINLVGLPAGVFTVNLYEEDQVQTRRIVIQ